MHKPRLTKSKVKPPAAAVDADPMLEEYRMALNGRLRHLIPVDQPIVLITQLPRSGGSLLMRLFDGHPECHTMAHEFSFYLRADPPLVPDTDAAWDLLHDDVLAKNFRRGFGQSHAKLHGDWSRYPMLIPPSFQRLIFEERIAQVERPTERDVMDAYLTSFFNAWLDNQNLYGPEHKKWVTVFTPRVLGGGREEILVSQDEVGAKKAEKWGSLRRPSGRKIERFRELYPDGRVISLVRDPVTWYASARRWSYRHEWDRRDQAMDAWCAAVQQSLTLLEEKGDEFIALMAFDDLVKGTDETMAQLAQYLGIRANADLTVPTFNRMPIRANSSFAAGPPRVDDAPLQRRSEVSDADVSYIRERAWDLYERALSMAICHGG
jgi:Sulfotransferase family